MFSAVEGFQDQDNSIAVFGRALKVRTALAGDIQKRASQLCMRYDVTQATLLDSSRA